MATLTAAVAAAVVEDTMTIDPDHVNVTTMEAVAVVVEEEEVSTHPNNTSYQHFSSTPY